MPKTYFVTGTDTDVGKTLVSSLILTRARELKRSCVGIKPIAAGAEKTSQGLRNQDALSLQKLATVELPYEQVNPYCFEPAIAPHLAAAQSGSQLSAQQVAQACRQSIFDSVDLLIIEGAGGWLVPLNSHETLADMVRILDIPVILVVAMRLGCINHAMLTARAIKSSGLTLAGWIANSPVPTPMPYFGENIATIKLLIEAPLLGVIPFQQDFARDRQDLTLDIDILL